MAADRVTVVASLRDELSRPIRRARGEIDQTTASLRRLARVDSSPFMTRVSRSVNGVTDSLKKADGPLRRFSEGLGRHVVSAARTAAIALGALGIASVGFGLKAAGGFEQSRIAFETMLGSVEKGDALFGQLQEFNKRTPFRLDDLTGATQTLLQFGIAGDKVMPIMESLANLASLSGPQGAENLSRMSVAIGQIQAKGRVMSEELLQLTEARFPAFELLSKGLGVGTDELRRMVEAGQVSADTFMSILARVPQLMPNIAQAAERQSQTFFGLLSTMADEVSVKLADAAAPLVDSLKPMIPVVTNMLGGLLTTIGPPIAKVAGSLASVLTGILPVARPILGALASGLAHIATAAEPALAALRPLGADLGLAIGEFFMALVPVMPDLVDAFVALVGVLPAFVRLLADMVPMLSPIARLVTAMLGFGPVTEVMAGLLVVLLAYRALSSVVGSIVAFSNALMGVATAQRAVAATAVTPGAAGGGGGLMRTFGLGALGGVVGGAVGTGAGQLMAWALGAGAEDQARMRQGGALIGGGIGAGFGAGASTGNPLAALAGGVAGGAAGYGVANATLVDKGGPAPTPMPAPLPPTVAVAAGSTSRSVTNNVNAVIYPTSDVDVAAAMDTWTRDREERS